MPQCRRHFCLWMIKITASRLHNADYFSLSTSNQGSSSPPTGGLRLKVCKRSHLGSSCIPSIGPSNVLARTRRVSSLFYFSSLLHTATWPGSVCSQHSYKYSALHYSTSPRALVERPPPGGSPPPNRPKLAMKPKVGGKLSEEAFLVALLLLLLHDKLSCLNISRFPAVFWPGTGTRVASWKLLANSLRSHPTPVAHNIYEWSPDCCCVCAEHSRSTSAVDRHTRMSSCLRNSSSWK